MVTINVGKNWNKFMTSIQFSHANGFPTKTYEYLFSMLKTKDIHFINTMGHIESTYKQDLIHLQEELIQDIEQRNNGPVIGIGHSSGAAATLLAAAKRPDLFKEVILLDPVLLGRKKRFGIDLMKKLGLWARFSLTQKAKRRRVYFKDKQQAYDYFKNKSLFKKFHPKCFDSYIEHGLKPSIEGVELSFSTQVEADIFTHVPTKIPKNLSNIKGTIIYGLDSDVFEKADVAWWTKTFPEFAMIAYPGKHLFPFEQPEETAELINKYL
ncbi:MAG: pimeloyl-ACP methyl ester carboxylesterase [Enterobacterales bacterium]|jgi:pimeloyl-ACP methyl ester carboxylesterase